ncbi:BMP family lipoprotein [Pasteuria penetrans]|uniref:BMP family lipoprotein n=1 Tax=Pasteuria penetrans TaxID=86005 RepID=UPI000F9806BE|nr:BMP family ABC transporter substrate-binding protein [Pasteuria penetrans]
MNRKGIRTTYSGIISLSLALFGLGGCNSNDRQTSGEDRFNIGLVLNEGGNKDGSYGQAADEALARLEKEGNPLTYQIIENKGETAQKSDMKRLLEKKKELMIGVSFRLAEPMMELAPEYPNTRFIVIDSDKNQKFPPNMASCLFNDHQGAFLAGLLAGYVTKTGKVGLIAGMPCTLVSRFIAGFKAGVKVISQAKEKPIEVEVVYANSFLDANLGLSLTPPLIAKGVDVFYHAAGKVAKGMFRAIRETKDREIWGIGTDKDQKSEAPNHIIGSVRKHFYLVFKDMINKMRKGDTSSFGRINPYGISEGAIDIKRDYADKLDAKKTQQSDMILEAGEKAVAKGMVVPATEEEEKSWQPPNYFLEHIKKSISSP